MNFVEAFKTGWPVKRKNWEQWISGKHPGDSPECYGFSFVGSTVNLTFSQADLLADDWEVEEKKVTITLNDLAEAFKRSSLSKPFNMNFGPSIGSMAKELGLL